MNVLGIVPARYASTRFPGKPLAPIAGKPLIQHVVEQCKKAKSLSEVIVATDDVRIAGVAKEFCRVEMTRADHPSGSDRIAEVAVRCQCDAVVNIQGDEPFIRPEQINLLISCFTDRSVEIATLVRKTKYGEDIFNPNQPKVILDTESNAIYFSRAAIPFIRGSEPADWSKEYTYFKHLGLYAYRTETLKKITKLPEGLLEAAESLEQNRWIENGFKIRCAATEWESIGIDTPEDLKRAASFF